MLAKITNVFFLVPFTDDAYEEAVEEALTDIFEDFLWMDARHHGSKGETPINTYLVPHATPTTSVEEAEFLAELNRGGVILSEKAGQDVRIITQDGGRLIYPEKIQPQSPAIPGDLRSLPDEALDRRIPM